MPAVSASATLGSSAVCSRRRYIDGAWDVFHTGHVLALQRAAALGDFLLVGVHDDATVNAHKGMNYPICGLHERALCLLSCRYTGDVVMGAPWVLTEVRIASACIDRAMLPPRLSLTLAPNVPPPMRGVLSRTWSRHST